MAEVKTVTCSYCGKTYDDSFEECPYCFEPKSREITKKKLIRRETNRLLLSCLIGLPFLIITSILTGGTALIVWVVFGICAFCSYVSRTTKIATQINEKAIPKIVVCPRCGSHDIAYGRKGYDWQKGFWYRMFNLKGGGYIAGMESRRITGHCNHCGNDWLTDREWIR